MGPPSAAARRCSNCPKETLSLSLVIREATKARPSVAAPATRRTDGFSPAGPLKTGTAAPAACSAPPGRAGTAPGGGAGGPVPAVVGEAGHAPPLRGVVAAEPGGRGVVGDAQPEDARAPLR